MEHLGYYTLENCRKILDSVENSKWRIWKIMDEDKSCYQNNKQINSPKDLFNFVRKCKNPVALYVSVSQFLKPESNKGFFIMQKKEEGNRYYYPKAGYLVADCIMLDSDLFIDLDSEQDLRIAQEDARKIITYLKDKLVLKELNFSGKKGLHLLYQLPKKEIADPIERIKYYKNIKGNIVNELLKLNLKTIDKMHTEIIKNVFAVRSAQYSIKINGNIVQPLDKEEFMIDDIYTLLGKLGVAREAKADDSKVVLAKDKTLVPNNIQGRRRAGISSCPIQYMCIANFVPGLKNNYVPFLKIHKKDFNKIDLNNLKNDISDMLIFEEENYCWIVSCKLFQKNKLLRIMKRVKAVNYQEFRKRYAKFRYTNSLQNKVQVQEPPRLIKKIEGKEYTCSRAHYNFFKELDIKEELLRGNDNLKTYLAEVEA